METRANIKEVTVGCSNVRKKLHHMNKLNVKAEGKQPYKMVEMKPACRIKSKDAAHRITFQLWDTAGFIFIPL